MSAEYYVFQVKAQADACVAAINGSGWFPVIGKVNGKPRRYNQQTIKWCDGPVEMLSGEWAVPRIPAARLDALKVPAEDRAAFLAVFGQDIRTLPSADFPAPPEE